MSDEIQYMVFGQWWVLAAAFSEIAPLSLRSWKKTPIPQANEIEPLDYTPVPEAHADGIAFTLYATAYNLADVAEQRSLGRITLMDVYGHMYPEVTRSTVNDLDRDLDQLAAGGEA